MLDSTDVLESPLAHYLASLVILWRLVDCKYHREWV